MSDRDTTIGSICLSAGQSLEVVLAGAITTTQPLWTATYQDMLSGRAVGSPVTNTGAANSTTPVSMVAALTAGTADARLVTSWTVYNADSVSATAIIQNNDGTARPVYKQVISTLATLAVHF